MLSTTLGDKSVILCNDPGPVLSEWYVPAALQLFQRRGPFVWKSFIPDHVAALAIDVFSGVFLSHPAIKSIETNTKRALEKSYKNTFFLICVFFQFSRALGPCFFCCLCLWFARPFSKVLLWFARVSLMVCSFFSGVCGLLVLLLVLFSWFARTFSRVFCSLLVIFLVF